MATPRQAQHDSPYTFDGRHARQDPANQEYVNHRSMDNKFIVIGVIAFVAIVLTVIDLARIVPTFTTIAVAVLGIAVIGATLRLRAYATLLQDRIIRIEMRLRLNHLLPNDLHQRIGEFTLLQLIGLRFASDGELPELARRVLDENIKSADDIKQLVKHWQPDGLRV